MVNVVIICKGNYAVHRTRAHVMFVTLMAFYCTSYETHDSDKIVRNAIKAANVTGHYIVVLRSVNQNYFFHSLDPWISTRIIIIVHTRLFIFSKGKQSREIQNSS